MPRTPVAGPSAPLAPHWPAFSSDELLDVIEHVYRPGWRKAFVECRGLTFRTLVGPSGKPLNGLWTFPLFWEPVGARDDAQPVHYLDSVCLAVTAAEAAAERGRAAAPFVDWSGVTSWDVYVAGRTPATGVDGFTSLRRKQRKLERDVGPVEFDFDDREQATLETLFNWKSAQYRRTGLIDLFGLQRNREFYFEMARRGLLSVATLRAGGRLVAAHAGNHIGGRFLYRLPAYDPGFARYSPGGLLTTALVHRSFEVGDREFDFLIGAEPYKFTYATHVRWIGPLGREPLADRTQRTVRALAGRARDSWRRRAMAPSQPGLVRGG